MSENDLKEGRRGAAPDEVLKDYEKSKRIREERDAVREAHRVAKEARAKVIKAERAFAPSVLHPAVPPAIPDDEVTEPVKVSGATYSKVIDAIDRVIKPPARKGQGYSGKLHAAMIRIPEELSQEIDRYCQYGHISRNAFLCEAVVWHLWECNYRRKKAERGDQ